MANFLFLLYWITAAVLAYVFFIYPALMAFIGLLPSTTRTTSKRGSNRQPTVSLIIPAHNEAGVIAGKLRNAVANSYSSQHVEIIVVSDGSDDDTVAIASQIGIDGLHVLDFPRAGKATALSRGVAEASGEIICFSDANVEFSQAALERLVERFSDPEVGAVTGDVRLQSEQSDFGAGESLFYRIERTVQLGESRIGSVMGVDGGMYAIRRSLYRNLASDTILDDFTVSMQIIREGFRVVYEPDAWAIESATPTSSAEYRRRVRVSAGAIQSIKRKIFPPATHPIEFWQYVSHKLLRWLAPYFLIILLVSNMFLVREHKTYGATLIVQLVCYTVGLAAAVHVPLRRWRLLSVPYYFILSHVAMVVGHVRGLRDKQPVTWTPTDRTAAKRA